MSTIQRASVVTETINYYHNINTTDIYIYIYIYNAQLIYQMLLIVFIYMYYLPC